MQGYPSSIMSSNNGGNNGNYQYASTTPSLSSILNLKQVQDKKKPTSLGVSGIPKPVGKALPVGLAVSKPVGILKLKPSVVKVDASVEASSTVSTMDPVSIVSAKTEDPVKTVDPVKISTVKSTTVKQANIVKPKSHSHSSSSKSHNTPQNTDTFNPAHWRLFVGNLGPEVTDQLLLTTFRTPYPSTSKALLVRDYKTQKPKGYGFVAFAEGKEFLRALKEMNGKWIGNRQCIIKKSEHQPKL